MRAPCTQRRNRVGLARCRLPHLRSGLRGTTPNCKAAWSPRLASSACQCTWPSHGASSSAPGAVRQSPRALRAAHHGGREVGKDAAYTEGRAPFQADGHAAGVAEPANWQRCVLRGRRHLCHHVGALCLRHEQRGADEALVQRAAGAQQLKVRHRRGVQPLAAAAGRPLERRLAAALPPALHVGGVKPASACGADSRASTCGLPCGNGTKSDRT